MIFYKILFIFIPLPFFFDLSVPELLLIERDDFYEGPLLPFPVGAISLSIALIFGYSYSLYKPTKMRKMLCIKELLIFIAFALPLLFFYAYFISGLSFFRIIQILFPMMLLSLMAFPAEEKDRYDLLKYGFLVGGGFYILHAVSVFFLSDSPLNPHPNHDFSFIFDYMIYQALVAYTGVIVLYAILSISIIVSQSASFKIKSLSTSILVALLYLLASAARRASLLELMLIFSVFLLVPFIILISGSRVNLFQSVKWLFAVCMFVFLAVLYFVSDLSIRTIGDFGSGVSHRFSAHAGGILQMVDNPKVLFFGGGGGAPGLHNFVLDQVWRIGLFGTFSVAVVYFFFLKKFTTQNAGNTVSPFMKNISLSFVFIVVFVQSMVNASFSQPYYFVNLAYVILMINFVVFQKKASLL